jgi:hypothetical protein
MGLEKKRDEGQENAPDGEGKDLMKSTLIALGWEESSDGEGAPKVFSKDDIIKQLKLENVKLGQQLGEKDELLKNLETKIEKINSDFNAFKNKIDPRIGEKDATIKDLQAKVVAITAERDGSKKLHGQQLGEKEAIIKDLQVKQLNATKELEASNDKLIHLQNTPPHPAPPLQRENPSSPDLEEKLAVQQKMNVIRS